MIRDQKVPVPVAPGVYKITCKSNGKFYVGSAVNLRGRRAAHHTNAQKKKHHNRHFQNVWNKYGSEAFVFEVLLVCAAKDAVMYEQRAIDMLKPTLNLSPTASSILGTKMTAEVKRRASERKKGKPVYLTPEQEARRVERAAAATRAAWKDPERAAARKINMAAAVAALPKRELTDEQRTAASVRSLGENNPHFGCRHSDEMRAMMSKRRRENTGAETVDVGGVAMTFLEMSEVCGLSRQTLRDRIHAGWTPELAMSTEATIFKKSEAHKAKLSAAKKGVPLPKRPGDRCLKPVTMGDVVYPTRTAAAAALGVDNGSITNWVKRGEVPKGHGEFSGLRVLAGDRK